MKDKTDENTTENTAYSVHGDLQPVRPTGVLVSNREKFICQDVFYASLMPNLISEKKE